MSPGDALAHELLQEQARSQRATVAGTNVLDVSNGGLQALTQVGLQRHRPVSLTRSCTGCNHAVANLLVTEQSRSAQTQSSHSGTGQGSDVQDDVRVRLGSQGDTISHDQAALSVSVQHLNGTAITHGDNVLRAQCVTAGHVLSQAQVAGDSNRNIQLSRSNHSAQNRCRTSHIALHGHHRSGRLQRVTTGIEGDTLTNQSNVSLRVLRGVLHNGKNRLAGRTLTNTGNAAEALLCQAVVVEQFNLNVRVILSDLSSELSESLRVQVRRGQVHQAASVLSGLAQNQAVHQSLFSLFLINRRNNQNGLDLFLDRILGLETQTLFNEVAQHSAVSNSLNFLYRRNAEIESDLLSGTSQLTSRRTGGVTQSIQALLTLSGIGAQTRQRHNAGTGVLKTGQMQQLIGCARSAQRLQQLVNTLNRVLRQGARRQVRAVRTLQNAQNQNVSFERFKVGAVNRQRQRHRYSFAYVFSNSRGTSSRPKNSTIGPRRVRMNTAA